MTPMDSKTKDSSMTNHESLENKHKQFWHPAEFTESYESITMSWRYGMCKRASEKWANK